jgi:predicted small lipoprotein YifL
MVKQIATPRRRVHHALIAALVVSIASAGCGVKGPLVPAPKAAVPTPPSATDAAPAERRP